MFAMSIIVLTSLLTSLAILCRKSRGAVSWLTPCTTMRDYVLQSADLHMIWYARGHSIGSQVVIPTFPINGGMAGLSEATAAECMQVSLQSTTGALYV